MITLETLSLLLPFVLAGGAPVTSTARSRKRDSPLNYVTIANSKYGNYYCLKNFGASMAGLDQCFNPGKDDPMSLFQLINMPTPYHYQLKSYLDGKCVDFTAQNTQWFNMVDCNLNSTAWVFNWNSSSLNVPLVPEMGTSKEYYRHFTHPIYRVISSPGIKYNSSNVFTSNICYTSGIFGGISLAKCVDSLPFTWFGYATDAPPVLPNINPTIKTSCSKYQSVNALVPACNAIPNGVVFRGTTDADGTLIQPPTKQFIPGMKIASSMKITFTFFLNSNQTTGFHRNIMALSTKTDSTGNTVLVGFDSSFLEVIIDGSSYRSTKPIPVSNFSSVDITFDDETLTIRQMVRGANGAFGKPYFSQFDLSSALSEYSNSYLSAPSSLANFAADVNAGPITIDYS